MTSDGNPIPLTRPSTDEAEIAALTEVLASGWLAGQGPQGTLLEAEFAALTGRRHAIAVNNCTAGLHLAVEALGVGPGREVLVADYTFPATAHAVLYAGGVPRFVDVRADTGTMDPESLRARISDRTCGVIGVDALGVPADWDEITTVAGDHGLWVLEDAACAVGGSYRDRPCGSFGDVAVFSLHARKGITSGEGGVIVTDDDAAATRMRSRSCFGMQSALSRGSGAVLEIPDFPELGYNYKLSDLLAGVARAQLRKLAGFLAERTELAARYQALLAPVPGIRTPRIPADRLPTWQTYAVTLGPDIDRDQVVADLRRHGIGSTIGTYALNGLAVYGEARHDCPSSDALFRSQLALPMFSGLTASDQGRVAATLGEVLAARRR